MIGRHRTHQDHDLATVVDAFHEGLTRSTVMGRSDPPRHVSSLLLRDRLAMPTSAGLRERLREPDLGTA
jgi:hypothetical protein